MLKSLIRPKPNSTDPSERPAQRDLTQGSLLRNIGYLAGPILISQLLFMAPSLYDAVWLGRIGSNAQAAAGLATSVRVTMISVLMALSGGGGAVVARYVGAKDWQNANRAVLQGVIMMFASSGLLGIVGIVFAEPLMRLAGADADVLPLAVRYARILFAGLIAMELVPSMGGMLDTAGAPHVGLMMRLWGMISLLIGEPLLVRWLGLEGAVLALVGSNAIGMLWGLGVLLSGRAPVRIDVHDLRIDFPMMWRIVRIALPGILQRGTNNLAMSVLMRFISGYGSATLAAWVVVQRVYQFAQIPGMSLARIAPAMVGQNLGAGKPERAERAVTLIVRLAAGAMAVVCGALLFLAPQVMALFSDAPQTLSTGTHVIRVLALGYLFYAINYCLDNAQAGAGDTVSPMLINILALWLVQLPLAYLLSRVLGLGPDGIWWAMVGGWAVQLTLMTLRYRQGRWKYKQIY
jgi:putative MATE family efflux protein